MSVAGDTGPYRDHASRDQALHLGVWVFLGSETLLFAGLFALYAAQRTEHAAAFHEAAAHNEVWVGTVNTIVLLVSSFFVAWAVHMVRRDRARAALLSLGATVLLGLTFLGLKAYEYAHHLSEGFAPGVAYANEELTSGGARMFFTLYYAMTGLHALHVIAGLAIIGVIAIGVRRRRVNAARPTLLELGGLYWHLVDVVWIFLWPLLYLSA
ncbi:MAG: cytochrome c oxidase subunit 3 family protein [Kofleriaceae bacterium]|nr:MAG: cytochrome c oxidase subunit 3 family protein [Kofleriaceae bacterium]MBZ0235931.1 cytochrome c oxidase subunit 3 [Kofleriaceae bacterium]